MCITNIIYTFYTLTIRDNHVLYLNRNNEHIHYPQTCNYLCSFLFFSLRPFTKPNEIENQTETIEILLKATPKTSVI